MAFTTKASLLSAVRRGDEIGWRDFYDNYKPLILLRGRDLRLNQTEKEELVQLVMLAFFQQNKSFVYDRSLGRFRDYLKRIIHNKACDLMRKRKDGTVSIEVDQMRIEEIPAEAEENWETEWRNHLQKEALKELRMRIEPTTYQSYHLFVVEGLPAKEVAQMLEIKPNAVYQHKSRVEEMLVEIAKTLED